MKIIKCKDKKEASNKALDLLKDYVDQNSLLLLSGGSSPTLLYKFIAKHRNISLGAVALIDERYGSLMHNNSNEKMISDTGLKDYINKEETPFFRVLNGQGMEATVSEYEQTIKKLFQKFPKKLAIAGIGADGHTAGIKPGLEYDHNRLVVGYNDKDGGFGKRITLSFEALSKINKFIILIFGNSKKKALDKLPSSFYNTISAEVIVLTDINFQTH